MGNLLSARIAALRKERGLTQEQLGQLMGVSAQAVSKWENGGAPDVELLPTLADRLGVTLDGLFGRDTGPATDISAALHRWLTGLPLEERIGRMYDLLAKLFPDFYIPPAQFPATFQSSLFLENCYITGLDAASNQPVWLRSQFCLDSGLCLSVLAKNLPVYLLMPEPPEGYERHFASNEEYRGLFQLLSQPGALELLRYLYAQPASYYTPSALAARVGLPPEEAERLLDSLARYRLLQSTSLELEGRSDRAYRIHDPSGLVPFLFFSRWLMADDDAWSCCWNIRKRPLLAPPDQGNKNTGERKKTNEKDNT